MTDKESRNIELAISQTNRIIDSLKSLQPDLMADVVDRVSDMAAAFWNESKGGIDLYNILETSFSTKEPISIMVSMLDTLYSYIKFFREKDDALSANAAAIWFYTVRCSFDPDLSEYGPIIWKELQRGFPYARPGSRRTPVQLDDLRQQFVKSPK